MAASAELMSCKAMSSSHSPPTVTPRPMYTSAKNGCLRGQAGRQARQAGTVVHEGFEQRTAQMYRAALSLHVCVCSTQVTGAKCRQWQPGHARGAPGQVIQRERWTLRSEELAGRVVMHHHHRQQRHCTRHEHCTGTHS